MSPAELLAALAGTWSLERRLDPGIGTMTGTATFTPAGPGRLDYREDGTLRLAEGFVGPATRSYRWIATDDGVDVLFAADRWDGKLMHALRFAPGSTLATASHPCGDDTYVGTYALDPPDRITIEMDVRGPAKDYRISTRLRRS